MKTALSATLLEIIAAVEDAAGDEHVRITDATIELPLEARITVERGRLSVHASPPHTRWKMGLLPEVSRVRLRIETDELTGDRHSRG